MAEAPVRVRAEIKKCFPADFPLTEVKLIDSPEQTGEALDYMTLRLEDLQSSLREQLQASGTAAGAGESHRIRTELRSHADALGAARGEMERVRALAGPGLSLLTGKVAAIVAERDGTAEGY
jgi:hypothetical protein